jgi:hypothetical protein
MPNENGETRRQRNEKFGQPAPDVQIPAEGAHVWHWFWSLSNRRRSGPEPLSYAEVGEWQRLTHTPIRSEEVEMLMRMDDAYLAEVRKEQAAAAELARESAK